MHPVVARLVSRPEGGIDVGMYEALATRLSIDAALDLIEIDNVGRSWRAAETYNNEAVAKLLEERNKVGHA